MKRLTPLLLTVVACSASHQTQTPLSSPPQSTTGAEPEAPAGPPVAKEQPPARECEFAPFAEEVLTKETPDPHGGQVKLLGDINGDDLADYAIEYQDRVMTTTWVFVQQAQGECWREVYDGAGFVEVTMDASEGWRVFNVPFVLNPMAGPRSPDYLTGKARAEYDSATGRYQWVRAAGCEDGSGKSLDEARCDEAFQQLKPKQ